MLKQRKGLGKIKQVFRIDPCKGPSVVLKSMEWAKEPIP